MVKGVTVSFKAYYLRRTFGVGFQLNSTVCMCIVDHMYNKFHCALGPLEHTYCISWEVSVLMFQYKCTLLPARCRQKVSPEPWYLPINCMSHPRKQ